MSNIGVPPYPYCEAHRPQPYVVTIAILAPPIGCPICREEDHEAEFAALMRIANAADLFVERSTGVGPEAPGRAEYRELLEALDAWDALPGPRSTQAKEDKR